MRLAHNHCVGFRWKEVVQELTVDPLSQMAHQVAVRGSTRRSPVTRGLRDWASRSGVGFAEGEYVRLRRED